MKSPAQLFKSQDSLNIWGRNRMNRVFSLIGVSSVLLICFGWSGKTAAQISPSDDGKTLILLLKPSADMARVGNMISGVSGSVMKSTTIQATGQQLLRVRVPSGTSADAQKSIAGVANPDITGVDKNYYLRNGWRDNQ
jgi:hypothetical protein